MRRSEPNRREDTLEQWKPVVTETADFTGLYEVSDLGRVRSLPRNGTQARVRVLKPSIHKLGYRQIILSKQTVRTNHRVARLVAIAFHPNPLNLPEVDHIDMNKLNDLANNLEWVTEAENVRRAHASGRVKNFSKITKAQVVEMRELRALGWTNKALAQKYKMHAAHVSKIVRGLKRKHAGGPISARRHTV